MGFRIITTFEYFGEPSKGRAKLRIRLQDGTELIATDVWPHYPKMQLVLHRRHLPENVKEAVRDLVLELQRRYRDIELDPRNFVVLVTQDLRIGSPHVKLQINYGNLPNTRIVRFDSKVVGMDVISS